MLFESILLVLYVMLVILNLLYDYSLKMSKYKYLKYISFFIYLLKLVKDIYIIIEYRNRVSIFAILIKKSLSYITVYANQINKIPFEVNVIYSNTLLAGEDSNNPPKHIISYSAFIKNIKLDSYKDSIFIKNLEKKTLFECFYYALDSGLSHISDLITEVKYYTLQTHAEVTEEDRKNMDKVLELSYMLMKLIIYFN